MDPNVDLENVATDPRCEGFSGADLSALVREAGLCALRACNITTWTGPIRISAAHLQSALSNVLPSVSSTDQNIYNRMRGNLRKSRYTLGDTQ